MHSSSPSTAFSSIADVSQSTPLTASRKKWKLARLVSATAQSSSSATSDLSIAGKVLGMGDDGFHVVSHVERSWFSFPWKLGRF